MAIGIACHAEGTWTVPPIVSDVDEDESDETSEESSLS